MKTGPLAVATAKQEVVNLLIDEIGVALEVLLVDVEPGGNPEESLEFRHAYNVAGGLLFRFDGGDHRFCILATMLPRGSRAPIDSCQLP